MDFRFQRAKVVNILSVLKKKSHYFFKITGCFSYDDFISRNF